MKENISIEDIKVNSMLQEAADAVNIIELQHPLPELRPELNPPDGFSKFISSIQKRAMLQTRLDIFREQTKVKLDNLTENYAPEQKKAIREKFEDWKLNPKKYATPDRDSAINQHAEKEIKKADPDFGRKYDFVQNERTFGQELAGRKFDATPNFTIYSIQGVDPGSNMSIDAPEPDKD